MNILTGCEPEVRITFDNHRDQDIRILIADVMNNKTTSQFIELTTLAPQTTKTIHVAIIKNLEYRIQAVTPSEEVVFSHDYDYNKLKEISWRIVILPEKLF